MRRFWLASPETRREANVSVFRDIAQIHDEMSRLFDDFAAGVFPTARAVQAPVVPRMDLYRKDGKIFLEMEIPGIDPKDVDLKVYPDRVVLKAERKEEKKEESERFFRLERSHGSFFREIPMPVEVDPEASEAKIRNGLLSLVLPEKQAVEEGRKLEIKEEA
jgi:HSP20 family protein